MQVEWLRHEEVKSLRVDDRFILIRTVEPVRRDKQGHADRLWFQVDTLELKDAAILKEMIPEYSARIAPPRTVQGVKDADLAKVGCDSMLQRFKNLHHIVPTR